MRQSTRTISAGVLSLLDHKGRKKRTKRKREKGGKEEKVGTKSRTGTRKRGTGGVGSRSPPRRRRRRQ